MPCHGQPRWPHDMLHALPHAMPCQGQPRWPHDMPHALPHAMPAAPNAMSCHGQLRRAPTCKPLSTAELLGSPRHSTNRSLLAYLSGPHIMRAAAGQGQRRLCLLLADVPSELQHGPHCMWVNRHNKGREVESCRRVAANRASRMQQQAHAVVPGQQQLQAGDRCAPASPTAAPSSAPMAWSRLASASMLRCGLLAAGCRWENGTNVQHRPPGDCHSGGSGGDGRQPHMGRSAAI